MSFSSKAYKFVVFLFFFNVSVMSTKSTRADSSLCALETAICLCR